MENTNARQTGITRRTAWRWGLGTAGGAALAGALARPAEADDPSTVLYVDAAKGSDTNSGTGPGQALKTLSRAYVVIGDTDATVRISAPIATPLREQALFTGNGTVVLEPTTQNEPWHLYGSYRVGPNRWTEDGGGVWRFRNYGSDALPTVLTMHEQVADAEFWLRLDQNTGTPRTPGEGEYGMDGADVLVHLPGDANPNQQLIELMQRNYALRLTTASGTLTARLGRFAFARSTVVGITTGNGTLNLEDCDAAHAPRGSGFSQTNSGTLTAVRCRGIRNGNDGFNVAGTGVMTLTDCEGAYNGDEGASPHSTSVMRVVRGSFHHNGYSGIAAVQSARMSLEGPTLSNNHRAAAPTSEGGLTMHGTVSATIRGLTVENDGGAGVIVGSQCSVIRDNVRSGTGRGNARPDDWSAPV